MKLAWEWNLYSWEAITQYLTAPQISLLRAPFFGSLWYHPNKPKEVISQSIYYELNVQYGCISFNSPNVEVQEQRNWGSAIKKKKSFSITWLTVQALLKTTYKHIINYILATILKLSWQPRLEYKGPKSLMDLGPWTSQTNLCHGSHHLKSEK